MNSGILIEDLLSLSVRGFINKKQSLVEVFHGISVLLKNEIYVPDEYKFLTKKFRELHATLLSKR